MIVTEANGSERVNGLALLLESQENLDRLELIWVDQGYQGARFRKAVASLSSANVEVMKRKGKGFQLLARRWVVERTFALVDSKTSFNSLCLTHKCRNISESRYCG